MSMEICDYLRRNVVDAPLSKLLPRFVALCKARGKPELERWARLELEGYWTTNPAFSRKTKIPEYRNVRHLYFGEDGAQIVFTNPKMKWMNSLPLHFAVESLERWAAEEGNIALQNFNLSESLASSGLLPVNHYEFSTDAVRQVLTTLRGRLQDALEEVCPGGSPEEVVEGREERTGGRMTTFEEKSALRYKLLQALYDRTDGNENTVVDARALAQTEGIPAVEVRGIMTFLEGEGLVKAYGLGHKVQISHAGVLEIEQARKNPDKPTQHFPPASTQVHVTVGAGAVFQMQNHSPGATQSLHTQGLTADSLKDLVNALKEGMHALPLSEEQREEVEAHVEVLELQQARPKLTAAVVLPTLSAILNLLTAAGNSPQVHALMSQVKGLLGS
jgi:hypothetical protein